MGGGGGWVGMHVRMYSTCMYMRKFCVSSCAFVVGSNAFDIRMH